MKSNYVEFDKDFSFDLLDNFLSEDEFKSLQEWAFSQTQPVKQNWASYLLNCNDEVKISKPIVYDCGSLSHPEKSPAKNPIIKIFQAKLQDFLNSNKDRYRLVPNTGTIKEFNSYVYRYKYGSGILMHRDSDKLQTDGKRYGITYYLNDIWNDNWGGELIVYSGGKDEFGNSTDPKKLAGACDTCEARIIAKPERNRMLIVDGPWHKVNPNLNKNIDRYAIQTFITIKEKLKHKTKPVVKRRTL